jgi:hypothetical protein
MCAPKGFAYFGWKVSKKKENDTGLSYNTHLFFSCDPEEGPWVASPRNGSIFEMLKYCSARPQKEKLWEAWIARSVLTIYLYHPFIFMAIILVIRLR